MSWNKDSGIEVFCEICILLSAVLLGIHINKWGRVSDNFYVSMILIIFFVTMAIGLRSGLKRN